MFFRHLIYSFAVFGCCLLTSQGTKAQEKKPPKITYDEHVKPIFRLKCFSCHNTDKKRADLDLSSYGTTMEGGASGKVINPGESSQSYLYKLITHQSEPFMPPRSPKLPDAMVETIRKWIDGGVLENDKSIATLPKRAKNNLALKEISTGRPKEPAMPKDLPLESVVQAARTTAVKALTTSPWAPVIAVGGQKQVLLYNSKTLELAGILPFPEGEPEVLKFSPNGSLLLAGGGRGGASGKVVVWDVKTGKRVLSVGDELDTVLAADISADHRLIALGGPQKVVRIYSVEDGRLLHELRKHTDWIYSLEFSPDGVLLASGDRNGGLFVWEAFTGRDYLTLKGHTKGITGVSWRADSNVVASCSEDATIRLWEMENGRQVRSWGGHSGGTSDVEFARNGRLVSTGRDRVTKLWDQNGKATRSFQAFSDIGLKVTFCDESEQVIAGDWNGEIRVWSVKDGKQIGTLNPNPPKLAMRLKLANEELAKLKVSYEKQLATAKAVQANVQKATQAYAAAQQAVKTTADAAKKAQVNHDQLKAKVTQAQAQVQAAQLDVQAISALSTTLTNALNQLKAAAAKAKNPPAYQKVVAQAQAYVTQIAGQLATAQKVVQSATATLTTTQQQYATAQKALNDAKAAATAAPKQVPARLAALKAVQAQLPKVQATLKAAEAAYKQAQEKVDRWKTAQARASASASKK